MGWGNYNSQWVGFCILIGIGSNLILIASGADVRRAIFALLLLSSAVGISQSTDAAKEVYRSSESAVFLVYVNDATGTPNALGSAFLVGQRLLITNAHVVEGGSPVLAVGPVRIPLKIVRLDRKKDLALLSVDAELTSKPLPLATGQLLPGEQIFAIGNPEGLEKTISSGIVSALRNLEGRQLVQISSPISHGSSGGPILNSKGEVVGVAVGMFVDGQNQNFAVPVADVQSLLAQKSATLEDAQTTSGFNELSSLFAKVQKDEYSNDPASSYQQDRTKLLDLAKSSVVSIEKIEDLRNFACFGIADDGLSDASIRAAQKLFTRTHSFSDQAILSYLLYSHSSNAGMMASFSSDGSADKQNYEAERDKFQSLAEHEAGEVIRKAKGDPLLIAKLVLAEISAAKKDYASALQLHTAVVGTNLHACDVDLTKSAYTALVRESDAMNRADDAEQWFRNYAQHYVPEPYEWDSEGDHRSKASDPAGAAIAYETAARGSSYYSYDYCYASEERYRQVPRDPDQLLVDGRACVDASAKNTAKYNDHYFTDALPFVYRDMAEMLQLRGVNQQALEYVKESMNAKADEPLTYDTEADIFENLHRYSECVAAEKQAIKLSDGRYSWMHFKLGNCYFDMENWIEAEASFRLAAQLDKTDAAAAFNLGLSLLKQGYGSDAKVWYQEALTRKPGPELKAKILRALGP